MRQPRNFARDKAAGRDSRHVRVCQCELFHGAVPYADAQGGLHCAGRRGEGDCFLIHANVLFLTEARPIPDTPRTLASTSPSGSVSPKIIQKISQGATPEHRTLQSSNLARCNKTTSHPATLSHHTLQHRAITPCHFRLSHSAMQKGRFLPPKSTLPDPFPAVDAGFGAPFGMRCATGTTGILPVAM